MDVTNPGLVAVADQVYGNPSTKADATSVPENDNVLVDVADSAQARPSNDVGSETFPIPAEVVVGEQVQVLPSLALGQQTPDVPNVVVADVVLGQGSWQLIDPADPQSGRKWVPVSEFVVAGPGASLQTNITDATEITETITAVRDANTGQPLPPLGLASRFLIYVNPATLTSQPISLLGREIIFDGNITPENEGASRIITGYGANFVVVDRNNPSDADVPILANPQIGDTFTIDTEREGSEEFSRVFNAPAEVTIFPDPEAFVPSVVPNFVLTDSFVSTGVQPNDPNDTLTSGVAAPSAIDVKVADQATTVGLPKNVFV